MADRDYLVYSHQLAAARKHGLARLPIPEREELPEVGDELHVHDVDGHAAWGPVVQVDEQRRVTFRVAGWA